MSGKSDGSTGECVGSVSSVVFGDFVPTRIKSLGDVVPLVIFVSIGVESQGSRLIGVDSKVDQIIESF